MKRRGMTLGWLVGAAARKAGRASLRGIVGGAMTAAALLLAGCSGEDGVMEEQTPQQPQQTAATIHVTVGAGISEGEGATRSTVVKDGSTRTLQFTAGDKLYVWGSYGSREKEPSGMEYYDYIVAGYLDLDTESFEASDPTNATFTGELTVYRWVNEMGHDEVLDEEAGDVEYMVDENGYYTPASSSPSFSTADPLGEFDNVEGTLIHKDAVKDVDYVIYEGDRMVYYRPDCAATVEELMTTKLWVSGDYDSGTKSFALEKDRNQPIVNCTISGLEAGVNYRVDYIYGTTSAMSDHTRMLESSLTATAGTLAFAFIAEMGDKFHRIRLTNTGDGADTYDVSIGQKALQSKVYNLSRRFVNLSSVSTSSLTLENGDIVRGTLNGSVKVDIASGATVTLSDADIATTANYAGIHCNGNTTIVVEGTNNIKGAGNHAGIFVGSNITILGNGSLTATGSGYGAGIGASLTNRAGNIIIAGGTIIANGGSGGGAGIGAACAVNSRSSCGNILIKGGTVTANGGGGGPAGAGIGAGASVGKISSCGKITITTGVTRVTAKKGGDVAMSIGRGDDSQGSFGTITIGCTLDGSGDPVGGETYPDGIWDSPFTYPATE